MAIWSKPLQFINVMLANRSPMSVAERGSGRMTYAKKKIKPFAEQDLRVTLECCFVALSTTVSGKPGLTFEFIDRSIEYFTESFILV